MEIWAIRSVSSFLQLSERARDLTIFNLAIDSKRAHMQSDQAASLRRLPWASGRHPPPHTQTLVQHRREHCVAVAAALALLDAQRHAVTVDVGDL